MDTEKIVSRIDKWCRTDENNLPLWTTEIFELHLTPRSQDLYDFINSDPNMNVCLSMAECEFILSLHDVIMDGCTQLSERNLSYAYEHCFLFLVEEFLLLLEHRDTYN